MDSCRPLRYPHATAERLAEWADEARRSGRVQRADKLLLMAWEAYDRPVLSGLAPTAELLVGGTAHPSQDGERQVPGLDGAAAR